MKAVEKFIFDIFLTSNLNLRCFFIIYDSFS